jgi:hypothetical protein
VSVASLSVGGARSRDWAVTLTPNSLAQLELQFCGAETFKEPQPKTRVPRMCEQSEGGSQTQRA